MNAPPSAFLYSPGTLPPDSPDCWVVVKRMPIRIEVAFPNREEADLHMSTQHPELTWARAILLDVAFLGAWV